MADGREYDMDTGAKPAEPPIEGRSGALGGSLCIAPWYSMLAHGFVSRLYLLDDGGWVMRYVEGSVLPTYEEAFAASRLLHVDADGPRAA